MQQDKPTRFRILDAIKSDGPQPVRTLSAVLDITDMAVRQHLVALERDGLVHRRSVRRPLGRPENVYGLTDAAQDYFPQHYDDLACDLLEHVRAVLGRKALEKLLQARLEEQVERFEPRMRGKGRRARLRELAAIQDEGGYMALCESDRGEIVQRNCCIDTAARRCPELCEQERRLFERLLGARVERVQHRLHGDSVCSYRVVQGDGEAAT